MKGVILAGGTGSRLHPLTRITNKHLLPIYDRPMISYAIEALVGAGVVEIMLVTGGTHAGEFLRLLGSGAEYGIERLSYGYQEKAGGIAEALGLAESFVAGDRCVVLLGDNIFEGSIRPCIEAFSRQDAGARVVLTHVADSAHLRHLGVAQFNGDRRIERIVEKPAEPPSDYAVTGVYFYDTSVWKVLREVKRETDPDFERFGQWSHSLMYPGVTKAWHIHRRQTDWWYVLGALKVALYDTREGSPSKGRLMELLMGDGEPSCLTIPPGVAHGCRALELSHLIYITSRVYSPDDEGRIPHDDPSIGYDWTAGPAIK